LGTTAGQLVATKFTGALEGNADTATSFKSAQTVSLSGDVSGSASSAAGWSITTTIGTGKVTNAMLAGSIANAKLANSSITIAGNSVALGGSLAAATLVSSLGLSKAMSFRGITTTALTDNATTSPVAFSDNTSLTPAAGDVVIYDQYEFVWTGSKWERLGGDSSYKITQSTVDSGNTTTNKWVARIQQNANGDITATMGTLDTSGTWSGTATKVTTTADTSNSLYLVGVTSDATTTLKRDTGITIKNGVIIANLTGNVTGNVTGSSGSCTGNAATASKFAAAQSIALTGDVTGSASSVAGWSIATTIGAGKVTNTMLAGSITKDKLEDAVVKCFTRTDIGTSPNYDTIDKNGLFELRGSSEVTGESGARPFSGYGPFLTFKYSNVMLQLAGTTSNGWFIRGTQKANVTLEDTAWSRLVTNSGTWDINITGSSKKVLDSNNSSAITFAYSKSGLNYADYTWLAAWNGYELRAVNKS